jgi:hypothetical protein
MTDNGEKVRHVLENSYFRATTILTMGGVLATLVWQVASWRSDLETAIKTNTQAVQALTAQLSGYPELTRKVDELNERIVGRGPGGWHRNDMRLWCLETELLNKDWLCAGTEYKP